MPKRRHKEGNGSVSSLGEDAEAWPPLQESPRPPSISQIASNEEEEEQKGVFRKMQGGYRRRLSAIDQDTKLKAAIRSTLVNKSMMMNDVRMMIRQCRKRSAPVSMPMILLSIPNGYPTATAHCTS
ncbi:hypothetical protein FHG87_024814 [Trinorchestia longiramus]|nr:hypothetical protein FHG87_024814 [Trinorchestia longiramus]